MKFLILIVALIAYVSAASVGSSDDNLPKEVDWRKLGAVTRVKSEGKKCKADYAFGAAGLLEAHHFIKTGKLVELSAQNLIDCQKFPGDGCFRSFIPDTLDYVVKHGIDTEESYPYTGTVGKCSFNASNVGARAKTFKYIYPDGVDENKLKEAVANIGPILVVLPITDGVEPYTSGILSKCEYRNEFSSQFMLLVGYGTDNETQQDYWILKNSWGTNWGENGYIRVIRNMNNHCNLAMYGYAGIYPVV